MIWPGPTNLHRALSRSAMIVAGLMLAATPSVQSQAARSPAPSPVAALEWLLGGTWIADGSKMAPGLERIETRYVWSDNNAFIRFTTHFVTDNATIKNYDGSFFWNPESSSLAMWYMDARNGITQGPVVADANAFVMKFHGPDFEGKPADLRVTVTRKDPNLYTWVVDEALPDGAWKPLASLDYRRTPGE